MNANPTLIHLAQLLAGRCPRRLLQGRLREAERAKDPGPGEDRGEAHHREVDRLLTLYRERGYWARTRVNVAFLETPLFPTTELDPVVADGERAAVVEVKTGEPRLEHLFQALRPRLPLGVGGATSWARRRQCSRTSLGLASLRTKPRLPIGARTCTRHPDLCKASPVCEGITRLRARGGFRVC
ncbi:hypothetical protein TthHC11_21370 (plasmid) [Thermus thermophilus]|uniref:hypothetical protein n=1 Tax=Thermus thermophilus TaxID=274 RepID=UPI001162E0A8|nr:hypothetical protein [Thermus thermophilus]BBL94603.1 hypothetical protein TthHC11_21370 [Thermus thermophilus]